MSYDRYNKFRVNGQVGIPPTVKIPVKSTDFYETYKLGSTRLDILSYDYYGDANYDWLILLANPSLADLEYNIPDGTVIRIPYPLDITLSTYSSSLNRFEMLYD